MTSREPTSIPALKTCTGACTWLGTGKVTIKDSTFYDNSSSAYGLYVESRGAITLTNVDASENDGGVNSDGARLYAHFSQLASAVIVTNGTFSGNGDQGLQVLTKGTITLTKVKAVDNINGFGVELNNTTITIASAVTVTGSAPRITNSMTMMTTGLNITSNGSVTVKYADASGNGGSGLTVFNTAGTGSVSVSKGTFGWYFDGNADAGISITTKGNVTISDVTATGYGNDGLHVFIDSTYNSTTTVTNSNFHGNGLNGLDIEGRGTITLSKVYASENLNLGAELAAYKVGNIIIKDSSFDYNGDHPYDYGLYAYSAQGTITLTNVSASWNTGTGAHITNSGATYAKSVSITGGNFNNNTRTGLQVYSKGAITLKNTNALENNESSIDLLQLDRVMREVIDVTETDQFTFAGPSDGDMSIWVTTVGFTPEIALSGCGTADTGWYEGGHYYSGLNTTTCSIRVRDADGTQGGAYEITATDPGVSLYDATKDIFGAYLDNTYGTVPALPSPTAPFPPLRVHWTITAIFTLNAAGGLILHTNGAVSLSNLVLDDNGANGLLVNNEDGGVTMATNVTLSKVYAKENYLSGISVLNKGNILMTNVASWGHMTAGQGYGASLNNSVGTGSVTIKNTIAMPYGYDYNHERGLNIFTNGKVTLTNVQLIGNDEDGIRVWAGTTGPTSVTLTNVVSNDNNGAGAVIRSFGPIGVTGCTFNDNVTAAAHFDNTYSGLTSPKPVTLSKVTAEDNPAGGIEIDTYGAVSLTDVTVDGSNNAGVVGIDISNYLGPYGVTLTKVTSNDSGNVGIFIITNGSLTYKGGDVKYNASDGISIYAGPEAIVKTVILSDLYIYDNDGYGASIYNQGTITLTNVRSNSNNAGYGMWLDNTACGSATPCNVSLLTSGSGVNEFNSNDAGGGLRIETYGIVVANKVSASNNEGYGMRIHNNSALVSKPANITVTGGTFNTNDGTGLYLISRGIITVNGVEASSNQNDLYGAYINNLADTTGNKGVNVLKSTFNGNTWSGLYLNSYGAVVLNTVKAIGNLGSGVDIRNDYGKGKPVTVLATYGANIFKQNISENVFIVSNGSVALTNVTGSESSTNDGIHIDNNSGTGTITLTNVTANSNWYNGFDLYTQGNVTIRGITAMFNIGSGSAYSGLYINTNNVATARVSITTGMITSNGDYGIQLDMNATKLYTLSGVFYFGNNSDGVGGELNLWVY